MNPFALSGLLIAVNSISLGILVLIKNPNRKFSLTWFFFSISAGIWGLGALALGFTKNLETARLIWRLSYVSGVVWIAPLFYHFVCIFLDLKRRNSVLVQYAVASFFALNVGSRAFFKDVVWVFDSFFYVRAGWLYGFYFAW